MSVPGSTLSTPLHSSSHTDLSHVLLDHRASRLVNHGNLHRHYLRNRCLRQHFSSRSYIRGVFGPPGATPLEPPYETRHRPFCFRWALRRRRRGPACRQASPVLDRLAISLQHIVCISLLCCCFFCFVCGKCSTQLIQYVETFLCSMCRQNSRTCNFRNVTQQPAGSLFSGQHECKGRNKSHHIPENTSQAHVGKCVGDHDVVRGQ